MIDKRIKELRLEKELSQAQLAKIVGLSRASICEYERGTVEPNIQTILALCKFFDCPSDYLLGKIDFY